MENYTFTGKTGYFITWADKSETPIEESKLTHLTQFSSVQFEKYKELGLDFHYELHFSDKKKFVRLDCHVYPYKSYHGYKRKDEMKEALKKENKLHLFYLRETLKEKFAEEFARNDVEFVAKKYNYLGLIKKSVVATDYAAAIAAAEKFIADTHV